MRPQAQEKIVHIKDIVPNNDNPRTITESKLQELCNSIKQLPEMLDIRPLVINKDNLILGGNQRYKALQRLGYEYVKVIQVEGLTAEQENEFIVKDNMTYGQWNYELLLDGNWDTDILNSWGVDLPEWTNTTDLDMEFDTKQIISKKSLKLIFTDDEYPKVINALKQIHPDHNTALLNLLEL